MRIDRLGSLVVACCLSASTAGATDMVPVQRYLVFYGASTAPGDVITGPNFPAGSTALPWALSNQDNDMTHYSLNNGQISYTPPPPPPPAADPVAAAANIQNDPSLNAAIRVQLIQFLALLDSYPANPAKVQRPGKTYSPSSVAHPILGSHRQSLMPSSKTVSMPTCP